MRGLTRGPSQLRRCRILAYPALVVPLGLLGVAALAGSAAAALPSGCAQSGSTVTCTFSATGSEQSFAVPAGVSSVTVTAVGGDGGSGGSGDQGASGVAGGFGASVTGSLPVTGGDTLYVEVGGNGQDDGSGQTTTGGFNGGGGGSTSIPDCVGGAGGGASDVRTLPMSNSGSLGSRLLVAAGGGGGGGGDGVSPPCGIGHSPGGAGGSAGQPGTSAAGGGGGAGTATAGGPGGAGEGGDGAGGPGVLGAGGDGQGGSLGGGGGGGGYYGGGGGGNGEGGLAGGGGGGGGSDYTGSATSVSVNNGSQASAGQVTISYQAPPVVVGTGTTIASSANPSIPGQAVSYTATVSPTDDGGTVAFDNGGTPIAGCTAQPLNSSGQATCKVTYPAAGSHAVTAVYSGDSGYLGSTSAALTQQVVADKADLTVKLSVPAQAADGASVTETVTVTNKGPASASKVITALAEPGGLTVTSAGGASVKGPVLTWTTASLAAGASQTFTVTAKVGAHADSTVLVAVGTLSATPDPDLLNNAAIDRVRLG
jgi:hypothetical protein